MDMLLLPICVCGGFCRSTSTRNVDPATKGNQAIYSTAEFGHTEIVRLLLGDSRVNPTLKNCTIYSAVAAAHIEIVQFLLDDRGHHGQAKLGDQSATLL